MSRSNLLLSIHPIYATKLFEGTKKVELRRVRPNVKRGDLMIIYATTPIKAIIGTMEVTDVIAGKPKELWKQFKYEAGIEYSEFIKYYVGTDIGFGITCRNPILLQAPIELANLKQVWERFQPPQVYRYLSESELSYILSFV